MIIKSKVCIVGLGPSGLGVALTLSKSASASDVICIEQGELSCNRTCSVLQNNTCTHEEPCHTISGLGGSSLLSGGKISSFPAGTGLANILGNSQLADESLKRTIDLLKTHLPTQISKNKPSDITRAAVFFETLGFKYKYYDVYQFKPEDLQKAYISFQNQLHSSGINILSGARLIDINRKGDNFYLEVLRGSELISIVSKFIVIGVGRSGQKILNQLNEKMNFGGKGGQLDIGVRLEIPTTLLPALSWYHQDLKLLFNNARTFCVCKGGWLAPYVIDGVFFADGNYNPEKTSKYTNLGIITRLKASSQNKMVLDNIRQIALKQRKGNMVCQRLSSYLGKNKNASIPITSKSSVFSVCDWGSVDDCFPPSFSTIVKKSVLYFAERLIPRNKWRKVTVFAPSVEYAGVSFSIKPDFSVSPGIYIIGDCSGQFRGIAQAFCSGIICGENILEKL